MKRMLVTTLVVLTLAGTALAADLPPGKWWRRSEVAQRLDLAPEQQNRLDAIFREAANDLIDRRAEVEKLSIAMRGELDQQQLSRPNVLRAAAKLSEARGRLFERELSMLVDMRSVLNDPQWNRLRAFLDRPRDQRGQGNQRPRQ
ncbi:MAG: periplasmic heavy metal sensor [Thermoanaerobaculia bacterium]